MSSGPLQAVVLCGGLGNRMTDLTDYIPKCMLPIAGVPMFWYPLNFLQKSSIKEVILVVAERLLNEIKQLLSSSTLPPLNDLEIDFVKLSNAAENWGTADVLRHIESRIKKDFIVVSGDFVSDMNLAPMFALHTAENAALTCLLCDRVITGPVPGPKIRHSKGRDFIVLTGDNQLLFDGAEEDYEDKIAIKKSILSKCRTANFTAKYNDCHVYIMRKWILNIIKKNRKLTSLKADVIPYILEKQYKKDGQELMEYAKIDPLDEKVRKFSFGAAAAENVDLTPKCYAYLVPQENGNIVAHVNNIGAYFEVNKAIIRFLPLRFSDKFPTGQRIEGAGAAAGTECYISSTARLTVQQAAGEAPAARIEKPVIKRSVIGDKCIVGPKAKIMNSVLMDDCKIGAGAQISNSILCTGAEVGENSEVSSSIVASRQIVPADAKVQNELVAPDDEVELERWAEEQ